MGSTQTGWHVRQGDVLIRRIEAIPDRARKVHARRMVLAAGEATGHAHVLERPGADGATAELLRLGDRLLARILGGDARVIHEEHAAVVLPPGEYEIVRQREYVPPPAGMPHRATTRTVRD